MALAQGVVDGLIGGLFMSAEIGKLKELAWEVENRRVGVMGMGMGMGMGMVKGEKREVVKDEMGKKEKEKKKEKKRKKEEK